MNDEEYILHTFKYKSLCYDTRKGHDVWEEHITCYITRKDGKLIIGHKLFYCDEFTFEEPLHWHDTVLQRWSEIKYDNLIKDEEWTTRTVTKKDLFILAL